jgi:hypothetical protein
VHRESNGAVYITKTHWIQKKSIRSKYHAIETEQTSKNARIIIIIIIIKNSTEGESSGIRIFQGEKTRRSSSMRFWFVVWEIRSVSRRRRLLLSLVDQRYTTPTGITISFFFISTSFSVVVNSRVGPRERKTECNCVTIRV